MPPRSYYSDPRVSDYVAFARAYFQNELDAATEFAERTGLPYVASSSHIAGYLGVSPSLVRQIMHKPPYHYREFTVAKADGTERTISTPKTYLKVIQWWILDNILKSAALHDSVHGFRAGRSYVTNAQAHLNSRHILNVDIKSFFDNIKAAEVSNVFLSLGYPEGGSLALTALTTKNGVAPTGAPTSPMIANLVLSRTDNELGKYAAEVGLIYTRYADDLTFSGPNKIGDDELRIISDIVGGAGFELNTKKTKFMGPGDRKEVTGVVTNSGLNAPREWRNWVRGYLHKIRSNPAESYEEIGRVRGVYGILLQFDSEKQKPLTRFAQETIELLRKARAAAQIADV